MMVEAAGVEPASEKLTAQVLQTKLPKYQGAKRVRNLGVPGNWGGTVCGWVEIDVLAATGAF